MKIFAGPAWQRLFRGSFLAGSTALAAIALAPSPARGMLLEHQVSAEGPSYADVKAVGLTQPTTSPNGEWFLFEQDADADEAFELWSVRRWGGAPVRLSALLPPGTGVSYFLVTPDSRRVVFQAAQESDATEVFSVPIEGPAAAAVKVSPTLAAGEVALLLGLSGDGSRAVTYLDVVGSGGSTVWSAPTDGSSAPIQLTESLPADRDLGTVTFGAASNRVFYTSDRLTDEKFELYSVPIDGSAAPIKLSPAMIANGDVASSLDGLGLLESPDGARLLFSADATIDEKLEIWTVPVAGPAAAATKLLGTVPDFTQFQTYGRPQFTSDGQRVVLIADLVTVGHYDLYSVPTDGSALPVQLDPALPSTGDVTSFTIVPGDQQVFYRADPAVNDQFEVFVTPVLGPGSAAYRVSGAVLASRNPAGFLLPITSGYAFLFAANVPGGSGIELWVGPFDGSSAPVKVSGNLAANRTVTLICGYDEANGVISYVADALIDEKFELFRAPIDASSAPVDLSETAGQPAGADVTDCRSSIFDGQFAFRMDREVDEQFELYREDLAADSLVKVNLAPVSGGDVVANAYGTTPDGYGIWFVADQDIDERFELFDADEKIFAADFEEGNRSEWSSSLP